MQLSEDRRFSYKWMVAGIFVCAQFMDIMDTTIVNVALPVLGKDFHAPTASIEWVVLGYLVALAASIPASGWLGDRFGTKRVFLSALVGFTAASMLCGQAQNLTELVLFRVLQGFGGGMLVPVGTAMLFRAFPPIERARVATILIIPTVIAPSLGPILGGWLVTYHSWRWIFYVNVPIGAVAIALGFIFLQEYRDPDVGKFDPAGFVLSATGLASFLYALSQGPQKGWASASVVSTGLAGIILLTALVIVELRSPAPMLAFRLYKNTLFRIGNNVFGLMYGSFASVLFLMPLYLQRLRGMSAFESGLTTFPQAIGLMIVSQFTGRIYHRIGPRRLVTTGMAWLVVTTMPFALLGLHTSLWLIRGLLFVRGMGTALVAVPMQAAMYANITPTDTGRASALFSAQRQMMAGIGVATLATVLIELSGSGAAEGATIHGFHYAFGGAAVFLVLAFIASLWIRDRDAAATMRSRAGRGQEEGLVLVE